MTALVAILALGTVAVVMWFFLSRGPERTATHEGRHLSPGRAANRDGHGPADAGAEAMTARPGESDDA